MTDLERQRARADAGRSQAVEGLVTDYGEWCSALLRTIPDGDLGMVALAIERGLPLPHTRVCIARLFRFVVADVARMHANRIMDALKEDEG